jgi:hypothetical protein
MVFQAKEGVDVEKTVTDTQFKIATNSKLFSILSDSIYTRKIDAVIRELCCNAFDAHVDARQSRPFQVTLPDEFLPEFRVRDFGSGLSDEDMQMYTTYGESTKSGSNAYIGAFGIGAKSPFAYTNTFNVTSYHGGMARSYSMFVEQGVPRMTKLGEVPSDDFSGLDVFFSVSIKDIDEFKERAIHICALMADKLEILNVPSVWRELFRLEIAKYKWEQAPYLGDGYMTNNLEMDISCKQTILNFVQGNVIYEMQLNEISEMLKYSLGTDYTKTINQIKNKFYITGCLKVPNGTFVPHPSRERLTFDEITKASIKIIFQKIFQYYVIDSVDRLLMGVASYYDLHTRLKGVSKLVTSNPKITDFICSVLPTNPIHYSIKIPTIVIPVQNYDEWRRASFPCIQVYGGKDKLYRLKSIHQMSMYGDKIERIYYSSKYPLAENYRYRVIHDKQQSEIENAIILTGTNSVKRLFTDKDIATFIDVQSLPKLTPQELAKFKKKIDSQTGVERATKETVSYLTITSNGERPHCDSIWLDQNTFDEIVDLTAKYPVYWIAGNRRYEIEMAGTTYKLKTKMDLNSFRQEIEFLVDCHRKLNNIHPKDKTTIGVAVLPDDHDLRELLPSLVENLQKSIERVVDNFMGTTFFDLNKMNDDLLFTTLVDKHPDLFMNLIKKSEAEPFFTAWFAEGKPEFTDGIKRWRMPWGLLKNGEALRKEYQSNKNVRCTNMRYVYEYLTRHGYPIMDKYTWGGSSEPKTVNDLVLYLQEKNKLIVQNAKDGN